jgi:hypothetical protein
MAPSPTKKKQIIYYHSDEEPPNPDSPSPEPEQSTGPQPAQPLNASLKHHRLPLDPGIIRTQTIDRVSSPRLVLRYDPTQPRPTHALTPTFGHLDGLYVGKTWYSRIGAAWDGTHIASVAGISGREGVGVWSIALSGGYEDDLDEGYRFVYTGSGGRNLKVLFITVQGRGLLTVGDRGGEEEFTGCSTG